jgi:predicted transcriptional regulator
MKENQKQIKLSAEVLKALREESGYSIEETAKKLKQV